MRFAFPATALAAFLVSAACAAAAAQPVPQAIVDATARALDEAADRDLRDPENPEPDDWGKPSSAMFQRLDVNGDGVADWRVDYEHAPNASLWCGTGGCRAEVWVSRPEGGHQLAMQTGVRAFDLRPARTGARLDLDFHGSTCGGFGAQECPRSYVWSEADRAFVPVPAPNGSTWLSAGPRRLEPVDLAAVPAEVRGAVEQMQAACRAARAELDEPASYVTRLPDVDGDGRRDWMVGSLYAACRWEEDGPAPQVELPSRVLVTAGRPQGLVTAFEADKVEISIDLATTPAAVLVWREGGAACEYEKPCGRRLQWNAQTGRLRE